MKKLLKIGAVAGLALSALAVLFYGGALGQANIPCFKPQGGASWEAGSGCIFDGAGQADVFVLDADNDTTISAPTDDQIDIEIAGADDFRFTANTFDVLAGSTLTISGGISRTGYERMFNNEARVGATAGWVLGAIDTGVMGTVAASQTAGTLVVPISGLRVGDTITGFKIHAQVESAGNTVTIDGDLRNIDNTAADPVDASVGTITQVSVTADTAVAQSKTGLSHVVLVTDSYYILITATTGATTDIQLINVTVTVTQN